MFRNVGEKYWGLVVVRARYGEDLPVPARGKAELMPPSHSMKLISLIIILKESHVLVWVIME